MAAKAKTPVVYAYVLYGGVMKGGYTYVDVSEQHPEVDLFDNFKPYFGDIKGRYVKCQKPLDEIKEGIAEALAEHKYSDDSEYLYKRNMEDVVKVLKSVTGAKQASTMGVYGTKDTEEAEQEVQPEPVKKTVVKKTAAKVEDVDEPTPVKKTAPKTTVKKTAKVVEEVQEEEEEEPEVKPVTKKVVAKPKTTSAKTKTVVEKDDDDEVVVQTKGKTTGKTGSKTQIVIPSEDEEEDI